jgi:transketolase
VGVCVAAAEQLAGRGLGVRVVSLPCWEWFEDQPAEYRTAVLPPEVPRLAVEAASPFGWERYADDSVTIDRFGASALGTEVLAHLGFTPENVADRAAALVAGRRAALDQATPDGAAQEAAGEAVSAETEAR